MADITAIPIALRNSRLLPLKPGTKTPAVKHAVIDSGQPWSPEADAYLAMPGTEHRLGIFMGGTYIVLDADIKFSYEDDGDGNQVLVATRDGRDDLARLMQAAGLKELPRTVKVRTQGGGTHWYFLANPRFRLNQKTIGKLDIRVNPNAYCAIGWGYQLLDDGGGKVAVMPDELAKVLQDTPHEILDQASQNGHREGTYGNVVYAFNNALTTLKGKAVELGWTEEQANDAVRAINAASEDPIPDERLEGTVLKFKGWQPGERLTDDVYGWALEQTGTSADNPDAARFLDVNTVKRLWTTERWREHQLALDLPPAVREKLDDVLLEPPPEAVIEGLMTIGIYGIAGPPESGKSLLGRDFANTVANGLNWQDYRCARRRAVTVVISEGHHDLAARWARVRRDEIYIYRTPVLLSSEQAVERFLKEHEGTDTGLVIFDLIYHMGIQDDNKSADVAPILKAGRLISRELQCAVLMVGHPGHSTGRRFRGTSIWRDWFDGEFHMADGFLTCEKHKYFRKETMEWSYETAWPSLHYLDPAQVMGKKARTMRIQEELAFAPDLSIRELASRLHQEMGGVGFESWRKLVSEEKKAIEKRNHSK